MAIVLAVAGQAEAADCRPKQPKDSRGVWIPGGTVTLGSEKFYPEERPLRVAEVGGFWIDATEVTNGQFAAFVAATGHRTVAERMAGPANASMAPGSAVFSPPSAPVDLRRPELWWRYKLGTSWQRPHGPGSTIAGKYNEPVVHVALEDALAYATWKGRDLPTEAQWEFAARGSASDTDYIWGNGPALNGRHMANSYQGLFPVHDTGEDGYRGVAPVGCFPPNAHGLYDMAGNVWEWTRDPYGPNHKGFAVIKGGSFLCALSFCGRFRPAARQPGDQSLGTAHIGFRTVLNAPMPAGQPAQ